MEESHPEIDARPAGGHLHAAISNGVVRILAEYTGRGPTRARTIINGDWVFVTLEDALTKGERKLGEIGRADFVLESRKAFQNAMRSEITELVQQLTGRTVRAFMSDNHIDPDVGLEALMLDSGDPDLDGSDGSRPVRMP
jgi:uncharacterized protein YbcI